MEWDRCGRRARRTGNIRGFRCDDLLGAQRAARRDETRHKHQQALASRAYAAYSAPSGPALLSRVVPNGVLIRTPIANDAVTSHTRAGTNPAFATSAMNHLLSRSALVVLLLVSAVQGCASSKTSGEDTGSEKGGGGSTGSSGAGGASGRGGGGGEMSGGTSGTAGSGSSGAGGVGVGGSGAGAGDGGSGAVGGNFACDEAVCVRGERYCRYYTPGTGGMATYSCDPFPSSCSARSDCSCFCTVDQTGSCRTPFNGMSCTCTHTDGAVFMTCAGA